MYLLKEIRNALPAAIKKPINFIRGLWGRGKVIYQARTPYSSLQVIDKEGLRYLVFIDPAQPLYRQRPEQIYQSYMDLHNPMCTSVPYADYFHLAWIFNEQIETILMIGLGGGTVAKRFLHDYPHVHFKTVEIDPVVVEVAYKYFSLPKHSRNEVVVDDGRNYLKKCRGNVDLILLDAFFSHTIPHHLFTKEFFREARRGLSKKGLLGININGALSGAGSMLFRSIYKTMSSIFPRLYVFSGRKESPQKMQNIIVFALAEDLILSPAQIYNRAGRFACNKVKIANYALYSRNLYQEPLDLSYVPVLSDAAPPPGRKLSIYSERETTS